MPTINLTANGRDQELILAYLTENASDALADKINNGTPFVKDGKQLINRKDLNGFMNFACDEAKKLAEKGARSACVEDSVVYGWAIHYFEEDSILGKLFNPDGTEYKPPAPVKKTATKPTTPATPPKPKSQFSFFDMLDEKNNEQKPEVTLRPDEQLQAQEQPQPIQQEQPKPKNELYEKYSTYVNRHPDSVIAIRVGDFYEVLGKRAVETAEELGLTLTSRDLGLEQRIPVIGIPYLASETYFRKLRKKHSVVVVEPDGERKLAEFTLEDYLDESDYLSDEEKRQFDEDDELTEDEMRQFDGDIQEPKDIPEPTPTCVPDVATDTDSPYDEIALAKVVKLLGDIFILR